MNILAIDPGPEQSAWLQLVGYGTRVNKFGIDPNWKVLEIIRNHAGDSCGWELAIEMIESFGMAVGADIFETIFWTGRFCEAYRGQAKRLFRKYVKLHLCQSPRAKDSNIRQALIDKFGGQQQAIGTKQTPGPLYGIHKDVWSALAIAVTYWETQGKKVA